LHIVHAGAWAPRHHARQRRRVSGPRVKERNASSERRRAVAPLRVVSSLTAQDNILPAPPHHTARICCISVRIAAVFTLLR
jgi:hypothetical protein